MGRFADHADADGVDATQACCACGGGQRDACPSPSPGGDREAPKT
jgi:hypothetical protein